MRKLSGSLKDNEMTKGEGSREIVMPWKESKVKRVKRRNRDMRNEWAPGELWLLSHVCVCVCVCEARVRLCVCVRETTTRSVLFVCVCVCVCVCERLPLEVYCSPNADPW